MNLKGNQRAGGVDQATHLLNRLDNDEVEIIDIRGTVAKDPLGFMCEIEAVASGSRCKKPFYALSLSPPIPLTPQQYAASIIRSEKELGLTGQPRIIIRHVKKGREHYHVVWSRIDFRTMKAIHLSHDRLKLQNVRRELAAEFGYTLPDVTGDRSNLTLAENAQAQATGITPEQRSFDITEAYIASDTGAAFKNALAELGYTLARGDKRSFVVVDAYGHIHSLTRQINGARTKHIIEKLAPLTPDDLPSVHELPPVSEEHDSAAYQQANDELAGLLRRNHAKRRAQLYTEIRTLEKRQAAELQAIQGAQQEELNRPFPRLVSTVFRLFRAYPALRSVIGSIHRLTHLRLSQRHILEIDAVRRRHSREWLEIFRRERLIKLLYKKEQQSLENRVLCALRLSNRKAGMFRINTLDIVTPSIFSSFHDIDDKALDPEVAALELEYMGMQEPVSLTAQFNAVASLPDTNPDDDGGTGSGPKFSETFNRPAS